MQTINLSGEYASQCPELDNKIPLGYINKNICGCGITTLALENDRDTIILVPNVNLIKNKCAQYPNDRSTNNLLGVYSGVSIKNINEYVQSVKPIKLLVTYDGLHKVKHLLDRCDVIVDESDRLLASVKLKVNSKFNNSKDVISYLFDVLEKYKNKVSFVSATPIPTKYLPSWVDTIPKVNLEWKNTKTCVPYLMSRGNPYNALVNEILKPIEETGSVTINDITITKVLVFIKSITEIKKVVQASGINKKEVGYIAGETIENDIKLKDYTRIEDPSKLPRYTFITSTGFQGIDLYDKEAISVVVSSTGKSFTMIDISSELKQAISRQRDKSNSNYGKYIYIYNQSIFSNSEEDLLIEIDNEYLALKKAIQMWENAKRDDLKEGFQYTNTNETFKAYTNFDSDTEVYTINENLFNADKYFLIETRRQYEKGFKIRGLENGVIVKPIVIPREVSFTDLANYLKEELKTKSLEEVKWGNLSTRRDWIDLLKQHYKLYNKVLTYYTKTKNMVEAATKEQDQIKIEVQSKFLVTNTYSRKEIKEYLGKLYKQYDLKRTPSHQDMYNWFNIKDKIIQGSYVMQILSHK